MKQFNRMKPLKIRILKSRDALMWYSSRLNEVFNVEYCLLESTESNSYIYWVREGGQFNCLNFVYENDCELIKDGEVE